MEYLMITKWNNTFLKLGDYETKYDIGCLKNGIANDNIQENTICIFINTKYKKAFKGIFLNVTDFVDGSFHFKYKLESELIYEDKYSNYKSGWYLLETEDAPYNFQKPEVIEKVKQNDEKDKLIETFYEIIKDYRADEVDSNVIMTTERISKWINQFNEVDREFMLNELIHIFTARYFSKITVESFLISVIDKLTIKYGYSNQIDFLKDTIFLDLQPEGKSQKVLLKLLGEILKAKYCFNISDCGNNSKKYFIYLDDILCTGNTLYYDIKEWVYKSYDYTLKNIDAIKTDKANIMLVYIVSHNKNYHKKLKEIENYINKTLKEKMQLGYRINVQNYEQDEKSTLDFVFPSEIIKNEIILKYESKITKEVDDYMTMKKYSPAISEYYRKDGMPKREILFTSKENRIRFENIILNKGIEILSKAKTTKNNIRALGFALPSQKTFGFGTLCFTWRNVPNNTPLVFWYLGGGFYPLFVKNNTN